jgi:N utilization substance protein B
MAAPDERRLIRECAVQALFQWDAQGQPFLDELPSFLGQTKLTPSGRDQAAARVRDAAASAEQINDIIQSSSVNWELDRIPPVERSILRQAVCEVLFGRGTPPRVAITESVELARTFGGKDSPAFVNGLLDAIFKTHYAL